MKKKIYIVDDHHIVIQGISLYLKGNEGFEIIGQAQTGEQAIEEIIELKPEILMLDIKLSGMQGFEIAEFVNIHCKNMKIIFLSSDIEKEYFDKILELGGKAYLSKDVLKHEFLLALKKVAEGDTYFSSKVQNVVLNDFASTSNKQTSEHLIPLSEREIDVIKLFVEGLSYKEIANCLNISVRTVETHKKNILTKLNLKTTVDLVKYALKNGIITL